MPMRVLLTIALVSCCGVAPAAAQQESTALTRWIVGLGGSFRTSDQPGSESVIVAVDLSGHRVDEDPGQLARLRFLPELHSLSVAGWKRIDDDALRFLADCPRIKNLDLSQTGVTTGGVARRFSERSLKSLALSGCEAVTDVSLEEIAKLTSLESLDISRTPISAAGLHHLAGLKSLRSLRVANCSRVTGAALRRLPTGIESLDLGGTGVSGTDLPPMPAVRSLSLRGCRFRFVKGWDLSRLYPRLAVLDLSGTGIRDHQVRHLRAARGLRSLNLSGTFITGSFLRDLEQIDSLEFLDLRYCRDLDDAQLTSVGRFTGLKELRL